MGALVFKTVRSAAQTRDSFTPEQYAVGRVLSGRFRVERLIGMGSMGVVLAARHLELGTRVAIKAMLPEMLAVPGMLSLFAREAKAAATIRSEHVAQVFDIGTDEALGPYIVMEYLEGRDLRALLERDGRVPSLRAVDYILQACEALAAAHAKGVIHRDIKPENLFLTRQGDLEIIKLLDFGVSKAALQGRLFGVEPSAKDGAGLMGTPLYMSPEQIGLLERVDHRADIWALGAVLYELVTGHSAFGAEFAGATRGEISADDLPALLDSICEGPPAPLSAHCSGLECGLQGVIDQCLDRNPARRFQNVAELAFALFPFASVRSQVHAQRAASILGTGATAPSRPLLPAAPSPAEPEASSALAAAARPVAPASGLFRDNASGTRLRPPPAALATHRSWAPPRSFSSGLGGASRSWLVGALSLGAPLLGALLLALGTVRSVELPVESLAAGSADAPVASLRSYPVPESAPQAPASRRVLVESVPSAAAVEVEGQVIGITPVATRLPAGTVLLSLAKVGYADAHEQLRVELSGPDTAPLVVRIALRPVADGTKGQARGQDRARNAPPQAPALRQPQHAPIIEDTASIRLAE